MHLKDDPRKTETTSRRRRNSKGAVWVESALIFLAFVPMLIGIFDFGQFLFLHQALVERARSSARWGATNGPAGTTTTDINNWLTSVQNMVLYNQSTAGTTPYLNLTSSNVVVTAPATRGTNDYRLTIQITGYQFLMVSPYISGTKTSNINMTVSQPLGQFF